MARRHHLSAALALIAGATALVAPTTTAQASTPGGKVSLTSDVWRS
ncbi:hypothetical protein [Streptomyces sp. NPDC048496]